MKFVKNATIILAVFNMANAQAGLFDSSSDFRCGREDAIKAVQRYIKDTASSTLQSDSLTNSSILRNKPEGVYLDKLSTTAVTVFGVSTTSKSSDTELYCQASVSVKLLPEVLAVIQAIPDELRKIKYGRGDFYNGSIVWKMYDYRIKLADNKKDILVIDRMNDQASTVLYRTTVLAENKDEIINEKNISKLKDAQSNYKKADSELNALWKEMPDSVRASMKASQLAWVKEKTAKCGKISDALSEMRNTQDRLTIFECQTRMTNERISLLGGGINPR